MKKCVISRSYIWSKFQLNDSAYSELSLCFYRRPSGPSSKSAFIIMDATRHIMSEALYHLMVMMLILGQGVQSMPVPTDVPMCTASEPAQYRITFTGKWSRAAFPKQYPVYRPPAQWSNIIGKFTANRC